MRKPKEVPLCERCAGPRGQGKRFCSHECANVWRRSGSGENGRPKTAAEKSKPCEHCKKLFRGGPWKLRKQRFCGNECATASGSRSGGTGHKRIDYKRNAAGELVRYVDGVEVVS